MLITGLSGAASHTEFSSKSISYSALLSDKLLTHNYLLNPTKNEAVLALFGEGSQAGRARVKAEALPTAGVPSDLAKMLGGLVRADCAFNSELSAMLAAGFHSLGRYWYQYGIPPVEKRTAFLSRVLGPAVSGVEAFIATQAHLYKVQARVLHDARRAMGGGATHEKYGHKVSLSTVQVYRFWQMAPVGHELRARMIK
eukprot:5664108-Pyramimonas_sp.AAC.1